MPSGAVDGLFEQRRDTAFNGLGIGARVVGADRDLGRSQHRKLGDRQSGNGDGAGENDEQRADRWQKPGGE